METIEDQAQWLEENLTDHDVDAWHQGELTPHVEELMRQAGIDEMQIWGSRTGREPLHVKVCGLGRQVRP